jgi:hypothetical protein
MSCLSHLSYQIESLRLINIVYYNPDNIDRDHSYFNPSNAPNKKTLTILMKTESNCKLPKDLKLKLVLTSYRNSEYNTIKLNKKIECHVKLEDKTDLVTFNFISENIPIPRIVQYIKPVYDYNIDAKCCIKPEIVTGDALEYCFLLYLKIGDETSSFGIPLTARYIGGDTKCDIKCEKVEYICGPESKHKCDCGYEHEDYNLDPEYPVALKLNKHKIYCKICHCVTHCQAPRPKQFYYDGDYKSCNN